MTEYLTPPELHSLTGYARATSQASWLKEHGIPHRLDGRRIIASRIHVQAWLEGRPAVQFGGINLEAVK
jgi:hypothetical protein